MTNILVIEDQEDSFHLVKYSLDPSYNIMWAKTADEAKEKFHQSNIDLVIMDISLPDGDGFELCSWIRQNTANNLVPIIFVSSNQTLESKVTALSIGGDDFVCKPFHLAELKARVDAKIRSKYSQRIVAEVLKAYGIEINLRTHTTKIQDDSGTRKVDLTPIEFKLLHCLMEHPGESCSRDELLDRVWGEDIYVYPRSVDTHISKLRKKLKDKAALISSVHGTGYKMEYSEAAN